MKKYIGFVVFIGVLLLFFSFGKEPNTDNAQTVETEKLATKEPVLKEEQTIQKVKILDLMLKAIRLPKVIPGEIINTSMIAETIGNEAHVTLHYEVKREEDKEGKDKREVIVQVSTDAPSIGGEVIEEINVNELNGKQYEEGEDVKILTEKEGYYYVFTGEKDNLKELKAVFASLDEAEMNTLTKWKEAKFPTTFPGSLLDVGEVTYTKGDSEEVLTVTYSMKEEYFIAYSVSTFGNQQFDSKWQEVKLNKEQFAHYSKEENRFVWQVEDNYYEITSYGRELTLEEFTTLAK